jgi:hypothetical protein
LGQICIEFGAILPPNLKIDAGFATAICALGMNLVNNISIKA